MPIAASGGKILVTSGGKLATTCSGGTVTPPPNYSGCAKCSCCGATAYYLTISGAAGAAAPLNGGWLLAGPGTYTKTTSQVSLRLTLTSDATDWLGRPYDVGCRNWRLEGSVGGTKYLDAAGDYNGWNDTGLGWGDCAAGGGQNGISFAFRPATIWSPPKVRLTISGSTGCAAGCVDGHPYHYFTYRGSASLNGVYELPFSGMDGYGNCDYGPITAGSYSVTLYGGANCTGASQTQTGAFTIRAWITQTSIGASAFQDHCPHPVPGAEFQGAAPDGCHDCTKDAVGGIADQDTRCPLAWGNNYQTGYARVTAGGTATLVGIYE